MDKSSASRRKICCRKRNTWAHYNAFARENKWFFTKLLVKVPRNFGINGDCFSFNEFVTSISSVCHDILTSSSTLLKVSKSFVWWHLLEKQNNFLCVFSFLHLSSVANVHLFISSRWLQVDASTRHSVCHISEYSVHEISWLTSHSMRFWNISIDHNENRLFNLSASKRELIHDGFIK